MPIQINRGLIGKEYPPYAVTVERGKIKEFARAIGDDNPHYLDDRSRRRLRVGDLIAPPTFAVTLRDETADTAAFLKELGTDISRILHGEQEFEIFRPLQPGRTYLCRPRVVDHLRKDRATAAPWRSWFARPPSPTTRTRSSPTMRGVTIVRL